MTLTKEQIRSAAMALNPAEREALAEDLLLSIDDSQRSEIDAAWLAESHRRDSTQHASFKPVDDVIGRLQNKAQR